MAKQYLELIALFGQMRAAQLIHAERKTRTTEQEAKRLEAKVDLALTQYGQTAKQQSLF